jgi:signal transduction histidine kinase
MGSPGNGSRTMVGDQRLLRLAVLNLIENAVKYTDERQEVKIDIGAQRMKGLQVLLSQITESILN